MAALGPRKSLGRCLSDFAGELRQFSTSVTDATTYLKRAVDHKPCTGGARSQVYILVVFCTMLGA